MREFPTSTGPIDYALFVEGKPVGVVEATATDAVTILLLFRSQFRCPQSFTEPVGIALHINQIRFICKPINDYTCNGGISENLVPSLKSSSSAMIRSYFSKRF